MPKTRKTKFLFFFLLLFFFLGAILVFAQKPLEVVYPQLPGVLTPTTTKTALPDYVRYIFQLSLFIGAMLTFGSLLYGGVRFLTSAGSPAAKKDAQSQISAGILGLIILVSAYIILNTINPQLVGWQVSLPGKAPTAPPAAGLPKAKIASYLEIPLGGLIENLWGERGSPPYRPAECYLFNENGDAISGSLTTRDRLECVKGLSEAIKIKGKKLKEPIEELQKLYDCQNCCRDCCKNACQNWVDDSWQSCGSYPCCEGQGMERQYYYQECPYNCCEFFQACKCQKCGFEADWCQRCNCICVRPDGQCCNPEEPAKHYEDLLVRALIDKNLIRGDETDPYEDISSVKQALKELRLKLGLFPLTVELEKNKRICCPGDTCPPSNEIGAIDCLLRNSETKDLIKKLLVGEPVEEKKLEEILKVKSVMKYLVESDLLSTEKNLAKTMLRNLDLLKNEIAINEIAWMGTKANPNQEWIELYNNTEENINLTNWKLIVKNKFEINLGETIQAQGFYLLENNEETISDIAADLIYTGNLSDSGEKLELYDEFGNLVEAVDCSSSWFAGEGTGKTSMERINSGWDGSERENWTTNLSIKMGEERKGDYINGKDSAGNPIYGTPKNSNSVGEGIISYPPFENLVAEMRDKLGREETLREKLILVLRQDENLARMLKSKEALRNILVGEDWRLKNLLSQRDVLRILIENKSNLTSLIGDNHAKEVIKEILVRTGDWKTGADEEAEWAELLADLDETRTNLKLINEFQRDLLWVLDARDSMKGCIEDPISYDQLRIPELSPIKIEKVPEWKDINTEVKITDPETGQETEGPDPTIFYCHKPTW